MAAEPLTYIINILVYFSVSLLFNFRPLFVNCITVYCVFNISAVAKFNDCRSCAGHCTVTTEVTAAWQAQRSSWWPGQSPSTRFGL